MLVDFGVAFLSLVVPFLLFCSYLRHDTTVYFCICLLCLAHLASNYVCWRRGGRRAKRGACFWRWYGLASLLFSSLLFSSLLFSSLLFSSSLLLDFSIFVFNRGRSAGEFFFFFVVDLFFSVFFHFFGRRRGRRFCSRRGERTSGGHVGAGGLGLRRNTRSIFLDALQPRLLFFLGPVCCRLCRVAVAFFWVGLEGCFRRGAAPSTALKMGMASKNVEVKRGARCNDETRREDDAKENWEKEDGVSATPGRVDVDLSFARSF